jgi:ATP-binding cassette subfamily B protein RaxB
VSVLSFGWSRRLPVVLQTEVAECGVACLAMILSFHGHHVDLDTLRRRHAVSLKGATLNDLSAIAGAVGLATRALRLELSELAKLRTPCILHWSLNHFVVLSRVQGKAITIHDPARGKRRVSLEEVSREFTGVALEVVPTKAFIRKNEPSLGFGYLLGSLGDLGGTAATVILLSVCLEIVALLTPIGAQVIVDEVITSSDYDLLLVVAAGIALLLLIQLVVEVARGWTLAVVQTTISLHWSSSLFDQMMRLPLEYFAKRHVGDVISRFGSLAIVQKALTTDVILSLFDGVMSLGMLIMLFLYGGWLAGIALVSTCLNALFRVLGYRAYRQGSEEAIIHDARQQTHFIETLRGIASVKLLGLTDRRRAAWVNHFVDSLNAKFRLVRLDLLFGRANDLLTGADRLLLLVLGARMVIAGTMSLGMLVAFLAYRDQFATRVQNLIGTGFQLKMLSLQLTRLADIVRAEPEHEAGRALNVSAISSIKFLGEALRAENVSFRYGDNEPWVFRNISLDIPPGKCVAITGPSGCGKTTFLKILMSLTRPTEGVISCGGLNINALGSAAYRQRIAGVLQDDGLFAGSLAENICGFDNHPDPEWMTECADRAAILEDIRQMPMGFETLVGDMGSTLSGGQKQRVILARALYRRPAILFLDEATSHLDEETEAVVAEALRDLRITRVIVAHRPATIANADELIKLESFRQSRVSSVGSTGKEVIQPSRLSGDARTMRDATQPLGPPLWKSNETPRSQAETSREMPGDQSETAVSADEPLARNIQAQEQGGAEETAESTSSAQKPKISALAPRGGESIRLALRTSRETPGKQSETAVVDAQLPRARDIRARNIQAGEQGRVEETTQRRSRAGIMKTSAFALAGAAIVSAVPTQLHAPRYENVEASSDAGARLTHRGEESDNANVVNSERRVDLSAKASLGSTLAPAVAPPPDEAPIATRVPSAGNQPPAPAAGGVPIPPDRPAETAASDATGTAKVSLDGAPAADGVTQPVLGVSSATSRDETPIVTEVPSATDSIKTPFANGAPIPPAKSAETVTSDSAGTAKESIRGHGPLSRHRHEVSSPDAIARTITTVPGATVDRRSHLLRVRTRTKPETAARAGKGAQDAVEPSDAPDAPDTSASQPADPLQLVH